MARSPLTTGCAALLSTTTLLILSLLANQVNAHGYVNSITPAGGKTITGSKPLNQGGSPLSSSAIRMSASEQPVILNAAGGLNDALLACKNTVNSPAGTLAAVTAGSDLSIQWVNGGGSKKWPHNVGPILTYLAACSDSTCNDDPTKLDFFKIAEDGQVAGSPSVWAQNTLFEGNPYKVTIPSSVPSGNYIMRHEVINLAPGPGNDESYPSCFELSITSSSSTPSKRDVKSFVASLGSGATVKFPGGYKAGDKGLNFDAYAGKSYADVFPGPAIPKALIGGGAGGGDDTSSSPLPSTSGAPKTSSVALPTTTSAAVVESTTSAAPSVPTTSPGNGGNGSPRVIVTTVTEVFVMTMTLDSNGKPSGNGNGNKHILSTTTAAPTTTTTSSSAKPTTTTSVIEDPEDDDDCLEEEEETEPRTTTTTSSAVVPTKSAGLNKRHISARVRRSERWRVAADSS